METTRFPLSVLEPGMTLSADILRDGSVLLEAGTEIGERVLKQLAAWGMTEKVTPASSRREPLKLSGGRKEAFTIEAARAWAASLAEKYGGVQPDLPATG